MTRTRARIARRDLLEAHLQLHPAALEPACRGSQDFTEGFFVEVLERGLLEKFDAKKARRGTYVRVCLDCFVSNEDKAGGAGDQPTMRGAYSPETKTITFELVSISNLKMADDGHMHHAAYTFLDNDHFKTTWTFRKDQTDGVTEDATDVRLK